MNAINRSGATKRKSVNLSMDGRVIDAAKALKLNLSEIAESAIEEAVREQSMSEWRRENAEAIKAYNKRIKAHGTLLQRFRRF